jgi:hypothetical protein
MATGNTSLLGLALPVQGELTGTWGDVVNQSITELVDSAVAGTTTLSTNVDVELTTTALAANQARQAIILWTASNGATTRNITAPARSKPYIVINAGTGSIVLRGAGTPPTTGITIVAGERCLAAWNGSDFVKIATTASGAAAGSNTQVQFNSSGNLAGSANLTFDGTNLTLGGGTANGVAYLNGSKVLTTGSALTFDGSTLGINQALNVTDGTDTLRSVVSSGVAFFGSSTSAPVAFRINSAEQMRLTSTGLGIGTSSPATKLNLYGSNVAGTGQLKIDCPAGDFSQLTLFQNNVNQAFIRTNGSSLDIGSSVSIPFTFATNGNERMRLDSSGNLGLGTTSPKSNAGYATFTLNNASNGGVVQFCQADTTIGQLFFDGNGGTLRTSGATSLVFGTNNTERARITSGGNLAVGTTSPITVYDKVITVVGSGSAGLTMGDGTRQYAIGANAGSLQFYDNTAGAERARITSAGLFGLGVTSPQAMFDLAGDYKEGVVTANTGTAYTINTATGTVQILTLTGNCTFTFPTAVAGESFTLLLRQDGTGSRTVTWPAAVRWPGGTAPTITATASRQDKYVFTADGTNWYGSNAGQNYTV